MNEQTTVYYESLQAALLNYDNKLWQIPALFIATLGLGLSAFDFDNFISIQNFILSVAALASMFILILLHNKALIFHISIQKKIDQFDAVISDTTKDSPARMSLTSMSSAKLLSRIVEMEQRDEAEFSPLQIALALFRVSKIVQRVMAISLIAGLSYCALCLSVLLTGK